MHDAYNAFGAKRVNVASIIPVVAEPKLPNGTIVRRNDRVRAQIETPALTSKRNDMPAHRKTNLMKVKSATELQKIIKLCYQDLPNEHMRTGAVGVVVLWKRIRNAAQIALLRFPVVTHFVIEDANKFLL